MTQEGVMTNGKSANGSMLGLAGLFLMLLVARLANHGGFLAERAIDVIAVIGWIADHLPRFERSELGKATVWTTRA